MSRFYTSGKVVGIGHSEPPTRSQPLRTTARTASTDPRPLTAAVVHQHEFARRIAATQLSASIVASWVSQSSIAFTTASDASQRLRDHRPSPPIAVRRAEVRHHRTGSPSASRMIRRFSRRSARISSSPVCPCRRSRSSGCASTCPSATMRRSNSAPPGARMHSPTTQNTTRMPQSPRTSSSGEVSRPFGPSSKVSAATSPEPREEGDGRGHAAAPCSRARRGSSRGPCADVVERLLVAQADDEPGRLFAHAPQRLVHGREARASPSGRAGCRRSRRSTRLRAPAARARVPRRARRAPAGRCRRRSRSGGSSRSSSSLARSRPPVDVEVAEADPARGRSASPAEFIAER